MSGSSVEKYVLPALAMVGGGATEIAAPGNPLGLAALTGGAGALIGGGAGGSKGELLGGLGGGALGAGLGLGGPSLASAFGAGGTAATPLAAQAGSMALDPSMALSAGLGTVSPATSAAASPLAAASPVASAGGIGAAAAPAATAGAPASSNPAWSGAGQVGEIYLNYLAARKLKQTPDPTAYAAAHSSPVGGPTPFNLLPTAQPSIPAQF